MLLVEGPDGGAFFSEVLAGPHFGRLEGDGHGGARLALIAFFSSWCDNPVL